MPVDHLTEDQLGAIVRSLLPAWPSEGCGLVLADKDGHLWIHPCANVADALHAEDPTAFPRTSRTAFAIAPRELLLAELRGDAIHLLYHSHCDASDELSAQDRRVATLGLGESSGPAWPGQDQLVVSIVGGRAVRASHYRYDDGTRRFERIARYGSLERFAEDGLTPARR